MSGYKPAYICKTANVITHVTAHFHVGPICNESEIVRDTQTSPNTTTVCLIDQVKGKTGDILDEEVEVEKPFATKVVTPRTEEEGADDGEQVIHNTLINFELSYFVL